MNKRWPAAVGAGLLAWYASDSLRHKREGGRGYELQGSLDVSENEFMRAAEALTGAPISVGNEIDLLINGDEIFPVYLQTIAEAEQTLDLLTYVYWTGEIAKDVAHAVAERARAGVECNVLLDALGAVKMDRDLVAHMTDAGANVTFFRPPKPYAVRRLENRTHRKILVADGSVGLIGGVGIAEEWTGSAQDPDHWRDTHVRVRGPVVRGLEGAFAESWLEATGTVLATRGHLATFDEEAEGWPMQVVRSKAGVGDTNVEVLYYLAIASARARIDLTAAYFAPRPAFTEALIAAAERGVEIRVLVPGEHIDKPFVRVAGRVSYDTLIDAGVRIWEYGPDDAARQDARGRRRVVVGRLGELRQSLVPAARRGDAVRAERGVRGPADRAVRTRPRGLRRVRPRALAHAPAARPGEREGDDARPARDVTTRPSARALL